MLHLHHLMNKLQARQTTIRDQAAALGCIWVLVETGVQLAEYERKSDMDRALLQAQLNQAGFTQAQQLAAQAFGQQGQLAGLQSGLAQQQLGLAQIQPQLAAQSIGMAQGIRTIRFSIQTSCSRCTSTIKSEWLHLNQLKDLQDLVKV